MSLEAWERYALKPMKQLWHPRTKFSYWHAVELAWMKARLEFGELPQEALKTAQTVNITGKMVRRVKELDTGPSGYRHDMAAFAVAVQEQLGEWANEYHKKITSYDIEDPALILMLRKAVGLILAECEELYAALWQKAKEHKWTLMIGRTHGQYAEPTTFGHLLMVYREAIARSIRRLEDVSFYELSEGKISGPVGIYGDINPAMEERALKYLWLKPAKAETQILQRDRHAAALSALAILAGTIEQMARTFWEMMRSDVKELREPRTSAQRGSSSMAWKRNPVLTEQLEGLPSLIRGLMVAEDERIATPEFRDISQSIVERFTLPDATMLVHYAVVRMTHCIERMEIFPERMRRNLENTQGVWAGQRVQIALMDAGVPYDIAYSYIQRAGFKASDEELSTLKIVQELPLSNEDSRTALNILGNQTLTNLFDPIGYIKGGIEHIFGNEKDDTGPS